MRSFLMLVCGYIPQEVLYSLRGIFEAVVAGRISHSQMGQIKRNSSGVIEEIACFVLLMYSNLHSRDHWNVGLSSCLKIKSDLNT